jgi:hypothetical protein
MAYLGIVRHLDRNCEVRMGWRIGLRRWWIEKDQREKVVPFYVQGWDAELKIELGRKSSVGAGATKLACAK